MEATRTLFCHVGDVSPKEDFGAVWVTVPAEVQVHTGGIQAQKWATKLVAGLKLVAGSGVEVPARVEGDRRIPALTKMAMRAILKRGYWNPTIEPFGGELKTGFQLAERSYSRMMFLQYDPITNTFRPALDLGDEWFWSPQDLNQKTREDYGSLAELFDIAQTTKARLCGGERRRTVYIGGIGRPKFTSTSTTMFRAAYDYPVEDGEEIPRSAIEDIDGSGDVFKEAYSGFEFLSHRGDVLNLENTELIYPKIDIRSEDFPQELREAHPEFFSGVGW